MAEVCVHLAEMWRRKLYAKEGYSSLFTYVTQKYHYAGGAAYRRIQAAKLYQRFPHIIDDLKTGHLNLRNRDVIRRLPAPHAISQKQPGAAGLPSWEKADHAVNSVPTSTAWIHVSSATPDDLSSVCTSRGVL